MEGEIDYTLIKKCAWSFTYGVLFTCIIFCIIFFFFIYPEYKDTKAWASNLCSDDAPEPCITTTYFYDTDTFCFHASESDIFEGVICIFDYKGKRHAWYDGQGGK